MKKTVDGLILRERPSGESDKLLTVLTAEEKNELNDELTEKLRRVTVYKDLFANNVAVYGREDLTVIACGVDTARIKRQAEEIRKTARELFRRGNSSVLYYLKK